MLLHHGDAVYTLLTQRPDMHLQKFTTLKTLIVPGGVVVLGNSKEHN